MSQEADFIDAVLRVFEFEANDELSWRVEPDGHLSFWAFCNDLFWWGTSDVEPILPEDLPLLQQTAADLKEAKADSYHVSGLYSARKRKMRPQGAAYRHWDSAALVALYDACGPRREPEFMNPHAQPDLPTLSPREAQTNE